MLHRKLIILLTTALTLISTSHAQKADKFDGFKSEQPTKCDAIYLKRIKHFETENPKAPKGGLVLLGDSITQSFPVNKVPKEWKLSARGISGDGVGGGEYRGLIDRLNISCHDLEPKKVFFLIGINDILDFELGTKPSSQNTRIRTYKKILQEIKKHNAGVEIYVSSTLPVRNKGKWSTKHDFAQSNEDILKWNKAVKALVESENNVTLVDMHAAFVGDDGLIKDQLTRDGVHLNRAGYDLWIEQLKAIME